MRLRRPAPLARPDTRTTLARRTTLVITGAVVLTVVVAALLSVGLVRSAAQGEARRSLGSEADVVAGLLGAAQPQRLNDAMRSLRAERTPIARVLPGGQVHGDRLAVLAAQRRLAALRAGRAVSMIFVDDAGHTVLAEGRPLAGGGAVVLARARADALGPALQLLRRQLWALGIALVVAVLAGILLARWLSTPLRRVAAAAHRLAEGERDVRIEPVGPAEVALVAEAVNTLSDALGASEARQREFLMSVSHELRTPLTAVLGYAESLADGVVSGAQVPEVGRTILGETQRLNRLVGDLLDLARLNAVDPRVDEVDVDLGGLLREAEPVWRQRCQAGGQRLRVEHPPAPLPVRTDPVRVRQVIDGLAENAVRVTPPGQEVVLAARAEDREVVLEVRDAGPGLADEDLAVAFERSVLHDRYAGRRPVGTGLGLAIVAAIAAVLGGRVQASHAPEGGACFRLVLPRDEPGGTSITGTSVR